MADANNERAKRIVELCRLHANRAVFQWSDREATELVEGIIDEALRELEDAILALDYVGEAVTCVVCGMRKNPRGRGSGAELANSLCHPSECDGWDREPRVDCLHPGESASEFGYCGLGFDASKRLWEIIRGILLRRCLR